MIRWLKRLFGADVEKRDSYDIPPPTQEAPKNLKDALSQEEYEKRANQVRDILKRHGFTEVQISDILSKIEKEQLTQFIERANLHNSIHIRITESRSTHSSSAI